MIIAWLCFTFKLSTYNLPHLVCIYIASCLCFTGGQIHLYIMGANHLNENYVGAFKRHRFLCSYGGNVWSSWCGSERYNYVREVFARLLRKYIEEIEGS